MFLQNSREGVLVLRECKKCNCGRRPVLIRRNLRKQLRSLLQPAESIMGTTFSALKATIRTNPLEPSFSKIPIAPEEDEAEEEDYARPAKRRKMDDLSSSQKLQENDNSSNPGRKPFNQVTKANIKPLTWSSTKPQSINPEDFYERSGSSSPEPEPSLVHLEPFESKTSLKHDILNIPPDFRQALQISLSGISNSVVGEQLDLPDSIDVPIAIDCECSVAIWCRVQTRPWVVKCRHVKECVLRIAIGEDGKVTRNLIFDDAFLFQAKDFFINRKATAGPRYRRGFADDYQAEITLVPVGSQKYWPPLDLSENGVLRKEDGQEPVIQALLDGTLEKDQLALYCTRTHLFDPDQQVRPTRFKLYDGTSKQLTEYFLDMQIRWAFPSHLSSLVHTAATNTAKTVKDSNKHPERLGSILETNASDNFTSPQKRMAIEASLPNSPADGRAKRQRSSIYGSTYNLKQLSAQAQGKSPRKRSELKSRIENASGTTVAYSFGRADAADAGCKQQTIFDSLDCPFCSTRSRTLSQLRFHLVNLHSNFKFSLRRSNPPRVAFFVEIVKARSLLNEKQRSLQLKKPSTLFDLEKYLNSDNSWIKDRQGPVHNTMPRHLVDDILAGSSSSSLSSRCSSPNTSIDDVMDLQISKLNSLELTTKQQKHVCVPKTVMPLYHPITKQLLIPGHQLPDSDDENDEAWLEQRHRDIVNDFTDLNDEEKEYINKWNPFITKEQLSSPLYLLDSLLRFAKKNRIWLIEKPSRKREFTKQFQTFIARGIVSPKDFSVCIELLMQTKITEAKKKEDADVEMKEEPPKARGRLECICGQTVTLVECVTCRGGTEHKCPGRFYHRECAANTGRSIYERWLCDHCFAAQSDSA